MGLKTRWKLSSDGTSYEQEPANPIPISPTRLDDLLVAMAIFPSRRRARVAIDSGRVTVGDRSGGAYQQSVSTREKLGGEGTEITKEVHVDHEMIIDPSEAVITIDGVLKPIQSMLCRYILLHKPRGYICSTTPEKGAPGVFDLIITTMAYNDESNNQMMGNDGMFTCGRLDCQSEGLLLITNDGKLGRKLLDPGRCTKRYEVLITSKMEGGSSMNYKMMQDTFTKVCREGQHIVEGPKEVLVRPVSMKIVELPQRPRQRDLPADIDSGAVSTTWIEVVLTDGRKRELRRLFGALGYRVLRLVRTEFGDISDDDLLQHPGNFRHLELDEILKLQSI